MTVPAYKLRLLCYARPRSIHPSASPPAFSPLSLLAIFYPPSRRFRCAAGVLVTCMSVAAAGIWRLKCFCRCFCCTFSAKPEPRIPCKTDRQTDRHMTVKEQLIFMINVCRSLSILVPYFPLILPLLLHPCFIHSLLYSPFPFSLILGLARSGGAVGSLVGPGLPGCLTVLVYCISTCKFKHCGRLNMPMHHEQSRC